MVDIEEIERMKAHAKYVGLSDERIRQLQRTPKRKPADTGDPWLTTAGHFILKVGGLDIGTFTEVSGLTVDIEIDKIVEGGENQFVHQFPGRMTWPNITLKRGIVDNDELFAWLARTSGDGLGTVQNVVPMVAASIALVTTAGDELRKWTIDRAFPVKWSGPTFAVGSTDIPSEELEIAHHGFATNVG